MILIAFRYRDQSLSIFHVLTGFNPTTQISSVLEGVQYNYSSLPYPVHQRLEGNEKTNYNLHPINPFCFK